MSTQGSPGSPWRDRWPGRCQVCGRWPAQPVCTHCLQQLGAPRWRCRACACVLPHDAPLCGACLTRPTPSPVHACVAALDYAYPWDGLIGRWKFQGDTGWASTWARLMLRDPQALALWRSSALVVPVPLGPARLAERGHNQAWDLVRALHHRATGPSPRPLADALVRLRETPDQHSLPRAQRLQNLRGVFTAHPARRAALQGRAVLLVDDVSTTGATLEAAAQALREGGAEQVSALVLARTPQAGE